MIETSFLNGQFLIAMPTLKDPNFAHSVTYVCEHNEEGALGLVINQASKVTFAELLEHMSQDPPVADASGIPILFGGPVQRDRGFVLHQPIGSWDTSNVVTMEGAFEGAVELVADLSQWETSKVTTLSTMFKTALKFNSNLGSWTVSR